MNPTPTPIASSTAQNTADAATSPAAANTTQVPLRNKRQPTTQLVPDTDPNHAPKRRPYKTGNIPQLPAPGNIRVQDFAYAGQPKEVPDSSLAKPIDKPVVIGGAELYADLDENDAEESLFTDKDRMKEAKLGTERRPTDLYGRNGMDPRMMDSGKGSRILSAGPAGKGQFFPPAQSQRYGSQPMSEMQFGTLPLSAAPSQDMQQGAAQGRTGRPMPRRRETYAPPK